MFWTWLCRLTVITHIILALSVEESWFGWGIKSNIGLCVLVLVSDRIKNVMMSSGDSPV